MRKIEQSWTGPTAMYTVTKNIVGAYDGASFFTKTTDESTGEVEYNFYSDKPIRPATDDLATLTQTVSDMMDTNDAIMETNRNLAARVAALEAKVDAPQQVTHATLNAVSLREISVCANALDGITRMTQPDQTTQITETAAYWSKKLRELVDRHMRFGADVVAEAMTPDPHAAAKERAKLWGARLIRTGRGRFLFFTDKAFTIKDEWDPRTSSLGKSDWECASIFSGSYTTESEAWSNFPTVPPPGWEAAKCQHADIVATTGDTHGQCVKCNQRVPQPRTEADRLGEACREAWWGDMKHANWGEVKDAQEFWRNAALAVRKAVLAAQLEPSEEEVGKACNAYLPHYAASTPGVVESVRRGVTAALRAAARVRLEKAKGEKP